MLLVHPASAGHGLNLQDGGCIAIWYTLPNWNLELYQQANARIYRQGQTPHPNGEIDQWNWFTVDQARKNIHDKSLAQAFLYGYLDGVYDFDPCDHKYDK